MYGGDSFIIMKDKKAISIKDSFFNSNSSFQHGTIFILFYGICKCACYTYFSVFNVNKHLYLFYF